MLFSRIIYVMIYIGLSYVIRFSSMIYLHALTTGVYRKNLLRDKWGKSG